MRCNWLQPAQTSSCRDPVNTDAHLQETAAAFSRPDVRESRSQDGDKSGKGA